MSYPLRKCLTCGHEKNQHLYDDGPCRPGFICPSKCELYVDPRSQGFLRNSVVIRWLCVDCFWVEEFYLSDRWSKSMDLFLDRGRTHDCEVNLERYQRNDA